MIAWPFIFLALVLAQMSASPEDDGEQIVDHGPVVVELFTSQGCPMCPEANRLLGEFAQDDDVIALAYGVSYWNMFGWEDRFARPEFNARQRAYVRAGTAKRVYTPHFVVNGAPEKLAFHPDRIRDAVGQARALPHLITLSESSQGVTVHLDGPARETPAIVWLTPYQPGRQVTSIESGSNAGIDMAHYNMATDLRLLGRWRGGEAEFTFPSPPDTENCAVIVQAFDGGPIISAARLR